MKKEKQLLIFTEMVIILPFTLIIGLLLKIIFIMYNVHIIISHDEHDEFTLIFNTANDEDILKKINYI